MNEKKKFIIVIFLIVFSLIFATSLFWVKTMSYPDLEIKVSDLNDCVGTIVNKDEDYYHLFNGKVYTCSNNDLFYSSDFDIISLKSYSDYLWVLDNGYCLKKINKEGILVKSYKVQNNTHDFLITKNNIYTISKNGIVIYNIDTGNIVPDLKYTCETSSDFISIYRCKIDNVIMLTLQYSENRFSYFVISDNEVIRYLEKFNIIYYSNEKILYYDMDTRKIEFYEYLFSDKSNNIQVLDDDSGIFPDNPIKSDGDLLFVISQNTVGRTFGTPPSHYSDLMKYHSHDGLYLINSKKFSEICKRKTRTFERIIYVDSEKTLTYYKGNYNVYSTENWNVIEKFPANEIKEGGTYTFEQCGEYIFVFDGDSGELLNKIKI